MNSNIRVIPYGEKPTVMTSTISYPKGPPKFVQGVNTLAFMAYGNTVPEALRDLAEGLERRGIKNVDGLTLHYDTSSPDGVDSFCVSAYVYPYDISTGKPKP